MSSSICSECNFLPCQCNPPPSAFFYRLSPLHSNFKSKHTVSLCSHYIPFNFNFLISSSLDCLTHPLTTSTRWKQRRQSVRELREQEETVRAEYDRLRELEQKIRSRQPPQYDPSFRSSGEAFVLGGGRPKAVSVTSSQASTQYTR